MFLVDKFKELLYNISIKFKWLATRTAEGKIMKQFGFRCVRCNVEQLTKALNDADYSMFCFGNVMKNQFIKEDVQFILRCNRQSKGQPYDAKLENGLIVIGNNESAETGCVVITDANIVAFHCN